MIATLSSSSNLFAPFVFSGSCDHEVFNTYLEKILLPKLEPETIVVLDNASFHKSSKIEHILSQKSCQAIFLPPYSPDLNPIENYWSPIKNDLKKRFRETHENPFEVVVDVLRNRST